MFGLYIILIISVSILFFVWLYLINIYEVKVETSVESILIPDNNSIYVSVIPLNSFGHRALFRNIKASFIVEEGKELIEKIIVNEDSNQIHIETKSLPGKIELLIKTEKGLFPTQIQIPILYKSSNGE